MDWIEKTFTEAEKILKDKESVFIGIDGRCASGKTTFAARLQQRCGGNLIHMDDFFLRPEQRTRERLESPGGNVDYERFLQEVMEPLARKEKCLYRPYDCHRQEFKDAIYIEPERITIVEGSYSCHPALWEYYDLHVFLTIDSDLQMRRISQRNKSNADDFRNKWIPMEEKYFTACGIQNKCEIVFGVS